MAPKWKDFLQACQDTRCDYVLSTSTQNLTFTIVKTDRKLISDYQCQKLHNNNNDKPPKTITNHVKYCIEISTFADKIDTSDI